MRLLDPLSNSVEGNDTLADLAPLASWFSLFPIPPDADESYSSIAALRSNFQLFTRKSVLGHA